MFRAVGAVSAVLALGLVACTSPEDQAAQELEEINQALEDAEEQNEEPEPSYLDLDPETENTIDFNGLEYTFSDFDRGVSTWGEEDTPYLGFDITVSNNTGETVDPGSGVNLWYAYGESGTEAEPVVDADNGIGTEEEYSAEYQEFGATIADGDEVTLRFGYELPEEETRFEIRLQPWDIDGEADVFLTGEIPQG